MIAVDTTLTLHPRIHYRGNERAHFHPADSKHYFKRALPASISNNTGRNIQHIMRKPINTVCA